ncbi:MAG: hypothetical protein JWQ98_2299 [Chlorobi bacterium]|nr:hypothetical protein [Chlorobiota bacterium]
MSTFFSIQFRGTAAVVIALLAISSAILCGCGDSRPDPKDFYKTWVETINSANGARIYDMLDTTLRHNLDLDIERMKGQADQLPPDARAKWDSIKPLKGRDAYAKMIALNKDTVAGKLNKDYQVMKVDTLVVMTVRHGNDRPMITWLRWEKGSYHITEAPQPPVDLPTNGQGGNPHGGMNGGGNPEVVKPAPGAQTPPAGTGTPKGK